MHLVFVTVISTNSCPEGSFQSLAAARCETADPRPAAKQAAINDCFQVLPEPATR
ncbi:MAG TPA: hypothetical protein VIA62_19095 [Thermoanaerobaculia bacterium]|jgi:hypothetical protein|nr:hypothetical protein [Thermoanaerobaculia bacterium]